jgi:hypothetical protein
MEPRIDHLKKLATLDTQDTEQRQKSNPNKKTTQIANNMSNRDNIYIDSTNKTLFRIGKSTQNISFVITDLVVIYSVSDVYA